jgi:hypothetical protein
MRTFSLHERSLSLFVPSMFVFPLTYYRQKDYPLASRRILRHSLVFATLFDQSRHVNLKLPECSHFQIEQAIILFSILYQYSCTTMNECNGDPAALFHTSAYKVRLLLFDSLPRRDVGNFGFPLRVASREIGGKWQKNGPPQLLVS